MIHVRIGGPEDIDARVAIDSSIASERVLLIDMEGAAPEYTIKLRWKRTKPEGARRDFLLDRAELASEISGAERFWVAEVDGYAAGFLVLTRWNWHPSTGDIRDIAVDRPYRGQGVGTALIEVMKGHARGEGMRGIFWEAQNDNFDAINFALRRGFAFAGLNDRFYGNEDRLRQRDPDFRGIATFLYWPAA